jgi:hypothetical protein
MCVWIELRATNFLYVYDDERFIIETHTIKYVIKTYKKVTAIHYISPLHWNSKLLEIFGLY